MSIIKKYKVTNKKRFLLFITFSLITGFIFISSIIFQTPAEFERENKYINVYVNNGDTLWDIAAKYNYSGKDVREFINKIVKENQLASAGVFPGQNLKIPVNTIK